MALRSIKESDIEQLRLWKNKNRNSFFYKDEITEEQQRLWYESYKNRKHDHLYILSEDGKDIGCIGIRLLFDRWDIYNVMIDENYSKNGKMSSALKDLLHIASCQTDAPITAKVLKYNPSMSWYLKNGFVKTIEKEDHYVVEFVGNPRLYE